MCHSIGRPARRASSNRWCADTDTVCVRVPRMLSPDKLDFSRYRDSDASIIDDDDLAGAGAGPYVRCRHTTFSPIYAVCRVRLKLKTRGNEIHL